LRDDYSGQLSSEFLEKKFKKGLVIVGIWDKTPSF